MFSVKSVFLAALQKAKLNKLIEPKVEKVYLEVLAMIDFDEIDRGLEKYIRTLDAAKWNHEHLKYAMIVTRAANIFIEKLRNKSNLLDDRESTTAYVSEWLHVPKVRAVVITFCTMYPCMGENKEFFFIA